MSSRLTTNILLLAAVIALYFVAYYRPAPDIMKAPALTTLEPEQVNEILIRHNQREIRLHRRDDGWYMTQPIAVRANDFRVDTLMTLLVAPSHADYDTAGLDLAEYGLARPGTTVRFNDVKIDFGVTSPDNGRRYVLAGGRMHLIDDTFQPLLTSQIGTLVAPELLPDDADISKLVLPSMTLSRNPDGSWRSNEVADTNAIMETLDNWKHTQAFGVYNYMRREPLARIEVYLGDQPQALHFVVNDTNPWLIISRPDLGLEYYFNLEAYDRLLRPGTAKESHADYPP